ncbi:TniB family NTP-binding protein [Roseibium aggregatum]|uniref:TniB family NTP-binding protein n=1 Tax=Roseibium aggregatum TaxID=187304 RepID=UPI00226C4EFE|nr:TniB family NTP-binding protein [Roseibium aggregatum]
MIEAPRQTRMPGLLVHGASGIGKTMIARNLSRRYAPEYDQHRELRERRCYCYKHHQLPTNDGSICTSWRPSGHRPRH